VEWSSFDLKKSQGGPMSNENTVRVFIGSGEASLLERKTLIHSLKKHSKRELEIYIFNGTHNSIESEGRPPVLANMSLNVKYRNYTEFSNYRWLIPEICQYQGKAIFLDSDMVCLSDIGNFFDAPMNGCDMLAKPEAYKGNAAWGMSAVLFDCSKCRFDLESIFAEVDRGLFTNTDFQQMSPKFLAAHPFKLGPIDPNWNSFDHFDADTKLIHYTNLRTQPWKFPGHAHESLWFKYFNEARATGVITQQDIDKTLSRAYARQDILAPSGIEGNKMVMSADRSIKSTFKKVKYKIRKILGIQKRKAA
jgi:lipopolysaccharide biosynthesis glycosyltransferase